MEPGELSTTDADYCVRITEAAQINAGGYFAMELYEQDQYPSGAVKDLSAGDIIVINGDLVEVASLIEHEEGMLEIRPSGEFDGMSFWFRPARTIAHLSTTGFPAHTSIR